MLKRLIAAAPAALAIAMLLGASASAQNATPLTSHNAVYTTGNHMFLTPPAHALEAGLVPVIRTECKPCAASQETTCPAHTGSATCNQSNCNDSSCNSAAGCCNNSCAAPCEASACARSCDGESCCSENSCNSTGGYATATSERMGLFKTVSVSDCGENCDRNSLGIQVAFGWGTENEEYAPLEWNFSFPPEGCNSDCGPGCQAACSEQPACCEDTSCCPSTPTCNSSACCESQTCDAPSCEVVVVRSESASCRADSASCPATSCPATSCPATSCPATCCPACVPAEQCENGCPFPQIVLAAGCCDPLTGESLAASCAGSCCGSCNVSSASCDASGCCSSNNCASACCPSTGCPSTCCDSSCGSNCYAAACNAYPMEADYASQMASLVHSALKGRDMNDPASIEVIYKAMQMVQGQVQFEAATEMALMHQEHERQMLEMSAQLLRAEIELNSTANMGQLLGEINNNLSRIHLAQNEMYGTVQRTARNLPVNVQNAPLPMSRSQLSSVHNARLMPQPVENNTYHGIRVPNVFHLESRLEQLEQQVDAEYAGLNANRSSGNSMPVRPAQHLQPIQPTGQLAPLDNVGGR